MVDHDKRKLNLYVWLYLQREGWGNRHYHTSLQNTTMFRGLNEISWEKNEVESRQTLTSSCRTFESVCMMHPCMFKCVVEKVYVSSHCPERESVHFPLWSCELMVFTTVPPVHAFAHGKASL